MLKNGSYLLREINAFALNEQTGNISLSLDAPLNVDASEVEELSLNAIKRLNTDNVELTWEGNNVLMVDLPIVEVEP